MIIRQLKNGELVWFGSDVGKSGNRSEGIWDTGAFDYELLTGLDLEISKKDGLDYRFSSMGHAMVLTGVNLDDSGMRPAGKLKTAGAAKTGTKVTTSAVMHGLIDMFIRQSSTVRHWETRQSYWIRSPLF